ncbi:MAG: FAD-dependent oxidoreductase [Thermodesulfobacteriota bacterium]|nr:FAD-dependent oxidoreductase [Thermodesulfobacteriota bacterium]
MKYVIIGNGVAAIGAVEGIRQTDRQNPITIIAAEPYATYGRPLIANLLRGKIHEADLAYRPEVFYRDNKVTLLLGRTATKIDVAARRALLEDGDKVPYDKLLIATGGKPFIPPIQGKDGPDVYTFTTLDDAKKLDALVGKIKQIVVIGGGLIGLKAAESLHDRGLKVTVVELADRILSTAFDQTAGKIIGNRLAEVGIEVITESSVKEIVRKKDRVKGIILNDGHNRGCEAVVIAIGVIPDKDIVKGTGIETNRGIVVNDYLETSVAGIYAAGDVAEALDLLSGERRVVPIWPNAYNQGQYAGRNMAGARVTYKGGLPMNSIEFYGIPTMSMGMANPADAGYEVITRLIPEKNVYRKLVLKDGILVGAMLIGEVERAGILTGLIRNRVKVNSFKEELMKDTLSLSSLPGEIRAEWLNK